MKITEFLLARISEDEAEANAGLAQYARGEGGSKRRWMRLLAECEAKRRVLDEAALYGCPATMAKALAAVYADHPDCDEAWR